MTFFAQEGGRYFLRPDSLKTSAWANETAFGILGNPAIIRLLETTLKRLSPCLCCYYASDLETKNYVDQELRSYLRYYDHQTYLGSHQCAEIGQKIIAGNNHPQMRNTDYKWLPKKQRQAIKLIHSKGIPLYVCARTRCVWITKASGVAKFNRRVGKKQTIRVQKPTLGVMVKQRYLGYVYVLSWPGEFEKFLENAAEVIEAFPAPESDGK